MSKRVLVTGGAGFISSNFVRHLLAHTEYEVVTLDALTYAGNLENLADVLSHPRLSFVEGDIRDAALVREVVEHVDVIVNAAAESHVEKSIEEGASEFVTTNVEGTQILLDAIRRTPVERFVLISSSEVYGTAETDPMDERHPLEPRSPYAATKAGGDRLAYSYFITYGLPIVIVRPFNNYGPHQHPEKVVPRFITQALAGVPLTIHGDGHASRDWLYVDDHAEAIEVLIEAPIDSLAGEVVNVATGVDISVAEIADLVDGVDVIVNAAAESHVEKSIDEGASEFVTTNVEGTQILLDAIRRTPVERFILISSSEVYGTAETDPMDERHPLEPRSPYAATKAGGDRLAYSYFVTYDLPIVIVRPFNNYGPRQHPEKVVPRFITQALTGASLTIHGDGHASRDWLYVDDHAEAIEALIETPIGCLAGEVVNVATGVDISVADIADLVLECVGETQSAKVHVPERLGQVDRHIGSTDKMAELTGWRARTTFAEGLEQTVAWYRENEAWWRSIAGHSQHVSSS